MVLNRVILSLCLCFMLYGSPLSLSQAFAYRSAPEPVRPIEYEGIRFEAPCGRMGYIEARDSKTHELLWEKQVYTITYGEGVEPDFYWVSIASLKIENGNLIVIDEGKGKYEFSVTDIKKDIPEFSAMLENIFGRYPFLGPPLLLKLGM